MPSLKLEVLNSAFKGKQLRLKDGLLVGSAPECQLRAQHPSLLPRHARFLVDHDQAWIEALDNNAKVVVNGQEVTRAQLFHKDVLMAGPIRLKVVDENRTSQPSLNLDDLLAGTEITGGGDVVLDFAKDDLFFLTSRDAALRQRIAFAIPSRDKFLDQAQVFLARLVKQSGAKDERVDAFITCAKELILNAHRHGHKYDESKRIILRYHDTGGFLSLSVEDQGTGFDHRSALAQVCAKDAATAARERYLAGGFGGLGFQLVTRLTDELVYNEAGNVVTFRIRKGD